MTSFFYTQPSPLTLAKKSAEDYEKIKKEDNLFHLFFISTIIFIIWNLYAIFIRYNYSDKFVISSDLKRTCYPEIEESENLQMRQTEFEIEERELKYMLYAIDNAFDDQRHIPYILHNMYVIYNYYRRIHSIILIWVMTSTLFLTMINMMYVKSIRYNLILDVLIIFFAVTSYCLIRETFKIRLHHIPVYFCWANIPEYISSWDEISENTLSFVNSFDPLKKGLTKPKQIEKIHQTAELMKKTCSNVLLTYPERSSKMRGLFKSLFIFVLSHKVSQGFFLLSLSFLGRHVFVCYQKLSELDLIKS